MNLMERMHEDIDTAVAKLTARIRKEIDEDILRTVIAHVKGTRLRGVQRFKTPNKVLLRRRQR